MILFIIQLQKLQSFQSESECFTTIIYKNLFCSLRCFEDWSVTFSPTLISSLVKLPFCLFHFSPPVHLIWLLSFILSSRLSVHHSDLLKYFDFSPVSTTSFILIFLRSFLVISVFHQSSVF